MKKQFFFSLAMVLTVSFAFSAGGGQKADTASPVTPGTADSPGWMANARKPVTLDWYLHASWATNQDWGKSKTTQYITQKTGFTLNIIQPAGNEEERLNAMIASNTLPDLFTINAGSPQYKLIVESGLAEPLNKLADQYDPYFYKVINPVTRRWYTEADGNIYAYPNSTVTPDDFVTYKGMKETGNIFLVRQDIYEAIGRPDMTTPEGFLGALRAAREKFPTVNGQPLIPLSFDPFDDRGLSGDLGSDLVQRLAISWEVNGKYDDPGLGPNNPEFVRWLKVFRQATQEGLIPTDVFVDKRQQAEEKIAQGRYFATFVQVWDYGAAELALYNSDPNKIYIGVPGPLNSRGEPSKFAGVGGVAGWLITMISKNCKDKGRAIQAMTYFISEEGQRDNLFGVPGEMYTMVNGKPVRTPEHKARITNNSDATAAEWGGSRTIFFLYSEPYEWANQDMADLYPYQRQSRIFYRDNVVSYAQYAGVTNFEPGSDEAIAAEEISRQWGRVLSNLLHAANDAEFDRIWNEYQKFKADHNYALIQDKATVILNENKKKIGIQ
ncbi:MAG: extracellular solute-binding protein [Treponema sp.]|nr:extracellular solute-binding protein [Treponema sp.]